MLLGAGQLHRRHFKIIRRLGYVVVAADNDPNAAARDLADHFRCIDPADPIAVTDLAKQYDARAVIPLTEFSVVSAAIAASNLGQPNAGVEAARRAHDKLETRQAWAAAGLAQPEFLLVRDGSDRMRASEALGFPLIVKPRSQSAARGVRVVRDLGEFETHCAEAASLAPGGFIVEKLVEGVEASVEGIALDGRPIVLAVGDKELIPSSSRRVTRSINYPASFCEDRGSEVQTVAAAAVRALGLRDSPFHLEAFVTPTGVIPIECGARGGGGHIFSDVVALVSGVNFLEAAVDAALGVSRGVVSRSCVGAACYRFLVPSQGLRPDAAGLNEAAKEEGVIDLVMFRKAGDRLPSVVASGVDRAGCLLTTGHSRRAAVAVADSVEASIDRLAFMPARGEPSGG